MCLWDSYRSAAYSMVMSKVGAAARRQKRKSWTAVGHLQFWVSPLGRKDQHAVAFYFPGFRELFFFFCADKCFPIHFDRCHDESSLLWNSPSDPATNNLVRARGDRLDATPTPSEPPTERRRLGIVCFHPPGILNKYNETKSELASVSPIQVRIKNVSRRGSDWFRSEPCSCA